VRWRLLCVHADGLPPERLQELPADTRGVDVPDGTMHLGRHHQPNMFEALLGRSLPRLGLVSRTHVQLQTAGQGADIEVTNLSPNAIYVNEERLTKGQSHALSVGQLLRFASAEGGPEASFLTLQACPVVVSSAPASNASARAEAWLELCGTGTIDVAASQRCLGPVSLSDGAVIVGRKHQPDLHKRAVRKEWLEFISREHFRVASDGAAYVLQVLTSNPLWHGREGRCPTELARGAEVVLSFGDCIIIDTDHINPTSQEMSDKVLYWRLRRANGTEGATAA